MKTLALPEKVLLVGIFVFVARITPLRAQPGALDSTFDPKPDGQVSALAIQRDDKLIIGGYFTQIGATSRNRIARLNLDGSVDASFDAGSGPSVGGFVVALQNDGKVLLGGSFTDINGTPRAALARLFSDGRLDNEFRQRQPDGRDLFRYVDSIAVQSNDRVLAHGILSQDGVVYRIARFNSDGSLDMSYDPAADPNPFALRQSGGKLLMVDRTSINRLNPDGSPDPSFNSLWLGGGLPNSTNITTIAVQANDKIIVAFVTAIGQGHVFRLESDGSWDNGFTPASANRQIFPVAVQFNGGIVIGGLFSTVNGVPRSGLARLIGDNPADKPRITSQPVDRAAPVGGRVVFSVAVSSFEVPTFQWQLNGANIPGATNRVLELTHVQLEQAGDYNVIVKNAVGSVESAIAKLVVRAAWCPAPSFAPARAIRAGTNWVFAAVGDFNGDSKPDLAVAYRFSDNVSVLLGNGAGGFQTAIHHDAGTNPGSTVVGDFNGDSKLDLAVANVGSDHISVLLGNGDGSFQAAVNYPTGTNVQSFAVADFDRDGKLDLAVANSGGVSMLIGKGDGTFQSSVNSAAGTFSDSLAVGDFNRDGKSDLAAANSRSDTVSILSGQGDGTFQPEASYGIGTAPDSVAVGDFNADGKPDLAVANKGSDNVSVLLGNGDGTFLPAISYSAGDSPTSVAVRDLNKDGKPDLAVATSNGVWVLLGNGDGTFQTAVNFGAGLAPQSVVISDFSSDGRPDLAVANGTFAGTVTVLVGNGDGSFQASVTYGGGGPSHLAVGDFNGDGKLDLAGANPASGSVSILLGSGDGSFEATFQYEAGTGSVVASDFNGDGKPDLAVSNFGGVSVSVLLSNGDGTFQSAVNYSTFAASARPTSVAVGDFNGDGKPDLALAIYGWNAVSVLLGRGDGTFQPAVRYDTGGESVGESVLGRYSVAVGDINSDGKTDLVVTLPGRVFSQRTIDGSISTLLGNGDGTFRAPLNVRLAAFPYSVAVGDFNGDGRPDLAAADSAGVSVLLGNGDGSYQAPVNYRAGVQSVFVTLGDFNGDGLSDLAVVNQGQGPKYTNGTVAVLLGNGDGTFQPAVSVGAGGGPTRYWAIGDSSVAVGDFNADDKPDLAVANSGSHDVSVLLNTCASSDVGLVIARKLDTVILSWPVSSTGFVCESTTSLSLTNWQPAIEALTTNYGRVEVTVPLDHSQRFFRLHKL